ncbi:MAG TPA: hypothetical protein VD969_18115 [Symbiobacteriaceae bacterium]|nr:hypothetical protein [Symbiobacteriaceae bacterium]
MKKMVALLLAVIALGVMSSVASAANGTIWPAARVSSFGFRVR